jgi:3-phosphoglycerate kinase
MGIQTIDNIEVAGKRVLVRVDFNVPLKDGVITDDTRIDAALPTIRRLQEKQARVILVSHLGRPKGKVVSEFSMQPIALSLSKKLGQPVAFCEESIGPRAEAAVESLCDGNVLLLENVRFHAGETTNEPELANSLSKLADVYVNDAFGTAHRAHASTEGVAHLVRPAVGGYLIEKELTYLGEKTANPERPFVVILGGAKVSDKISVIDALLEKADCILIGGAMAYTFKLALGGTVGSSLAEPDKIQTALQAIEKAKSRGVQFLLPEDNLVCSQLDFKAGTLGEVKTVVGDIDEGWEGVDIGPATIRRYSEIIHNAKTVLWNGPMGIFEIEASSVGTFAIAKAIAEGAALSIIGGGDSVKAIKQSGYAERVSFMSTGGGASLEFLEGKRLPGVEALDRTL